MLREIAISKEMIIYAGSINRDHVHMLISIPPQLSVSRAVQYLKGKSSHRLLSEYKALRKRYRGQHLWATGYNQAPMIWLLARRWSLPDQCNSLCTFVSFTRTSPRPLIRFKYGDDARNCPGRQKRQRTFPPLRVSRPVPADGDSGAGDRHFTCGDANGSPHQGST